MSAEHRVRRSFARAAQLLVIALLLFAPTHAFGAPLHDPSIATIADTTITVTVTTTADAVDGAVTSIDDLTANPGPDTVISLREAMLAADATAPGPSIEIAFNIPTTDPSYNSDRKTWSISLTKALPPLKRGNVTIDGATQPGAGIHPPIVIDGYNVAYEPGGPNNGLTITSANNTVRRLTLMFFYDSGIVISGTLAMNNQIAGCYIGTDPTGTDDEANGTGITIRDDAHDNLIGGMTVADRNLISGNNFDSGVVIRGSNTNHNTIAGNWIGIDASGMQALPNAFAGVHIADGAHDNLIGGTTAGSGNVISGNDAGNDSGIYIEGSAYNRVAGNIIGLAPDGQTVVGNRNGILIVAGAHHNVIGGTIPGARNIISGNNGQGIYIANTGSNNNHIQGNYIGVDQTGNLPRRGNHSGYGVLIGLDAQENLIGDTDAKAGNVISYNGYGGIWIASPANQVAGNVIGLGADGVTILGNQNDGVRVSDRNNLIGPFNTIVHNQRSGIKLTGSYTKIFSNTIQANDRPGICVAGPYATITGNTITGNSASTLASPDCDIQGGIVITASNTLIQDNSIRDNNGAGITVRGGSSNRLLTNSISNNATVGIQLEQGGNNEVSPPVINRVSAQTVTGKSCGECLVELFADPGNEGEAFIASTITAPNGEFNFSFPPHTLIGPFITATHTDQNGNTSPFAAAVKVPADDTPGETPTPTPTPGPAPTTPKYQVTLPLLRNDS